MENQFQLADINKPLVLDASVVINLLGTGQVKEILNALGHQCIIEVSALKEINRDPITQKPAEEILNQLAAEELLVTTQMEPAEEELFLQLVSGSLEESLDDGEAATIAVGRARDIIIVLDERKGSNIVRARFEKTRLINTLDLFQSKALSSRFSSEEIADLVYSALIYSRMRVPKSYRDWIVDLIGENRARECSSIGKLK